MLAQEYSEKLVKLARELVNFADAKLNNIDKSPENSVEDAFKYVEIETALEDHVSAELLRMSEFRLRLPTYPGAI